MDDEDLLLAGEGHMSIGDPIIDTRVGVVFKKESLTQRTKLYRLI